MIVPFKLVLATGALIALPFAVPADESVDQQPPNPVEVKNSAPATQGNDEFRQEANWNFAELQYVTMGGERRNVAARRITKMWLLRGDDGV